MPDDERNRRRVSDETKGRIADLASGWTVDPEPDEAAPEPAPPPVRRKQKTIPPPPPGSEARRELEGEIVRAKPPTQPPPVPPRKAGTTQPPPLPPQVSNKSGSVPAVSRSQSVPVTNRSGSLPAMPPGAPSAAPYTSQQKAVPRGEFDHAEPSGELITPTKPPTTLKEAPLEVLVPEGVQRDDATSIDPGTTKFERGDPTALGQSDPALPAARPKVGRLRTIAALRRQRGWFGDVRYVATVLFGVRRSRRELAELELKQQSRQAERERYLVTLGRTAVITDSFDHPALGPAREKLAEVEDERSRHRSQVGAADDELQRVTREREAKAKQYTTDLASIDAELAELAKRLEPLQKEQASATRRAADLREQLRRIDMQIQETTASLVAVRSKKDPAAIQAELATLKADREATKRDEPKLAQELDSLSPRIAAIEAKRVESTKKRAEMIKAEEDDKGRTEELLAAIGAKRKVMDRAANDAEALRDKILFELAERLYVDRPSELGSQLAPIDAIDVELGSADRRVMELREIMDSIDRRKLFRGIAMIVLAVLLVGGFTAWILYMAL
ncbi:MAG: hypothetical protein AB7T06_04050 [Kofleriaceae bacterium]